MLGHLKVNYVNMIVLRKFTLELEYMGVHSIQLILISNKRIRWFIWPGLLFFFCMWLGFEIIQGIFPPITSLNLSEWIWLGGEYAGIIYKGYKWLMLNI